MPRSLQCRARAGLSCVASLRHLSAGQPQRAVSVFAVSRRAERRRGLLLRARRPNRDEYDPDYVVFDDEEDWEQEGTTVQAGLGPIFSTALRGVTAISDRLTEAAVQVAPADASPAVVRVAVNAGLVLLSLSFVKSLLSFFLTLGTIILGAYVAVKVFGMDVAGIAAVGSGDSSQRPRQQQQRKRRPDPRARQSEFKGLLGTGSKEEDGLLDVWFQRRDSSTPGGGKGRKGSSSERARRR